jgi:hypothetical protein
MIMIYAQLHCDDMFCLLSRLTRCHRFRSCLTIYRCEQHTLSSVCIKQIWIRTFPRLWRYNISCTVNYCGSVVTVKEMGTIVWIRQDIRRIGFTIVWYIDCVSAKSENEINHIVFSFVNQYNIRRQFYL